MYLTKVLDSELLLLWEKEPKRRESGEYYDGGECILIAPEKLCIFDRRSYEEMKDVGEPIHFESHQGWCQRR